MDAELGDIALAYETCLQEATQYNTNFASYVQHLTIHGILHLVGYDHSSDPDATLMEDLESQILGNLSFESPYLILDKYCLETLDIGNGR